MIPQKKKKTEWRRITTYAIHPFSQYDALIKIYNTVSWTPHTFFIQDFHRTQTPQTLLKLVIFSVMIGQTFDSLRLISIYSIIKPPSFCCICNQFWYISHCFEWNLLLTFILNKEVNMIDELHILVSVWTSNIFYRSFFCIIGLKCKYYFSLLLCLYCVFLNNIRHFIL